MLTMASVINVLFSVFSYSKRRYVNLPPSAILNKDSSVSNYLNTMCNSLRDLSTPVNTSHVFVSPVSGRTN